MKVSLATQLVLAHETGAANTVDPLAGSYFVESLTTTIEEQAWTYLNKIDDLGDGSMLHGMLRAIESGYIEREIANSAYEYQMAIEAKDYVVVGVNEYQPVTNQSLQVFEFDHAEEERQLERLREARRSRSGEAVERALANIRRDAESDKNLFPAVLHATKACATGGEVMSALREVYGEYRDPGVF